MHAFVVSGLVIPYNLQDSISEMTYFMLSGM